MGPLGPYEAGGREPSGSELARPPATHWDLASLAKPWNLENLNWATLKKHGLAYFQNILKIGVCFQTILKKYPLLRARRRPEGAAEGGAGGIFSK